MTGRGRGGKGREGLRREAQCHRAHTNGHSLRAIGAGILYLISEYTGEWMDIHQTLSHTYRRPRTSRHDQVVPWRWRGTIAIGSANSPPTRHAWQRYMQRADLF